MVRNEAAKTLLDVPPAALPSPAMDRLRAAMGDWQAGLLNRADFPETHLILAGTALTQRNMQGAQRASREVVRMDPQREDPWVMLVRIADAAEGLEAAMYVVDEALEIVPDSITLRSMRADFLPPPQ